MRDVVWASAPVGCTFADDGAQKNGNPRHPNPRLPKVAVPPAPHESRDQAC